MADILSINNIYQLAAFLTVVGLQIYTRYGVNKLADGQTRLKTEIEATRGEMFRLIKVPAGFAATIEAALKVAYLQGKADAKGDVPYPQERIATAARQLAEVATQGQAPEAAAPP